LKHPGYPGIFPGTLVGLIEKHDKHMREDGCQKQSGGPTVQVSEQPTQSYIITHLLNTVQGFVGLGGKEEEHKYTRDQLENDEGEGKTTKTIQEVDVRGDL
jgi:hypothetical protein